MELQILYKLLLCTSEKSALDRYRFIKTILLYHSQLLQSYLPPTTSLNQNMLMFQMNGKLELQELISNSCNVSNDMSENTTIYL